MRITSAQAKRLGILPAGSCGRKSATKTNSKKKAPRQRSRLPEPAGEIALVIPGKAVPKERPRTVRDANGDVRTFTPGRTTRYSKTISTVGQSAMRGYGPFSGPVACVMTFVFPVPRSWSAERREKALAGAILPTIRPDLDNVAKTILDGLNGIVFYDDAQITTKTVSKVYGATPETRLVFRPLAAEPAVVLKKAA